MTGLPHIKRNSQSNIVLDKPYTPYSRFFCENLVYRQFDIPHFTVEDSLKIIPGVLWTNIVV